MQKQKIPIWKENSHLVCISLIITCVLIWKEKFHFVYTSRRYQLVKKILTSSVRAEGTNLKRKFSFRLYEQKIPIWKENSHFVWYKYVYALYKQIRINVKGSKQILNQYPFCLFQTGTLGFCFFLMNTRSSLVSPRAPLSPNTVHQPPIYPRHIPKSMPIHQHLGIISLTLF